MIRFEVSKVYSRQSLPLPFKYFISCIVVSCLPAALLSVMNVMDTPTKIATKATINCFLFVGCLGALVMVFLHSSRMVTKTHKMCKFYKCLVNCNVVLTE